MTTIAEIRARRAAITPGEWYWNAPYNVLLLTDVDSDDVRDYILACQNDNMGDCRANEKDRDFIAAAPADIDHLLATIDKLAAKVVMLSALVGSYERGGAMNADEIHSLAVKIKTGMEQEFGL